MKNLNLEKLTEEDLQIFAPHTFFFALTLLTITLCAGIGIFVVSHHLDLHVYMILGANAAYTLIFNAFVMMAVRGRNTGFKALKASAVYFLILAVISAISSIGDLQISVAAMIGVTLGITAVKMTNSERYRKFSTFTLKRWKRYRDTGITLLEQYKLQQAQEALSENKKSPH